MSQDSIPKEISLLGEDLGNVLLHVCNDLFSLRAKWGVYRSLFGTNEQRVSLLNDASELAFYYFEKSLFENTIMGICRITDPVGTGGRKNVSVFRLKPVLESCGELEAFNGLCRDINKRSRFARNWRNKILAHSDDDVRNGRAELDIVSVRKVDECLDAIAQALKLVYSTRFDTHLVTRPIIDLSTDELQLLRVVYDGVDALAARRERSRRFARQKRYDDAEEALKYPDWLVERPAEDWVVD